MKTKFFSIGFGLFSLLISRPSIWLGKEYDLAKNATSHCFLGLSRQVYFSVFLET